MTSTHDSPFGALLRRHRTAARLTQEKLAERAGISLRAVVALENGERLRPHRDTVRLLADALRITGSTRLHFEAAARGRDVPRETSGQASGPALTPLAGRTRELELLERHLAGLGPPVLVLTGEPGIGKTRLLRQAAEQAARRGLTVIAGGCQRRSGQEPYAPFPRALARYLETLPAATLGEVVGGARWLVRLLPELVPLLSEPVGLLPHEAGQERRLLFDAVERLCANIAAAGRLVFLLDDLQWAPVDALDLLTALVNGPVGARLRVICAYRNTDVRPGDPLTMMLADLAHAGLAEQRVVETLSPREAEQLLAGLVNDLEPESAEIREAVRRTGGVPFYVVSYAHERNARGTMPNGELPWSVAQSVRQRVAALSQQSQDMLAVAAMAGRVVPRVLLATMFGNPEVEMLAGLEAACRARLLQEADEHAYQFVHDVIREVIEADLSTARRTAVHRHIAEALELLPEPERRAAELAWHFLESGDAARALGYALLAGEQAHSMSAHQEAAQHYRTALELARQTNDAVRETEALEKLGWVLWIVGRYDEALDALESAAQRQHCAGTMEAEGRIAAKIGWVLSQEGRPEEGISRLQTAVERLEGRDPSRALIELYTVLVHLFMRQGRTQDLITAAERVSELALALGDDRVRVQGELNRGLALYHHDRFDDALRVLEDMIPAAEMAGDSETLARALIHVAAIYVARGEFDRGRRCWERVVDLRQRTSSPDRVAAALTQLGDLLLVQGDWGEARANYERAARLTSALTTHQAGWVRRSLAHLCLLEGKWQDAAMFLEQFERIVERTGDRQSVPQVEGLLAERDLLQGRTDAAVSRIEALLGHVDLDHYELGLLAESYLETGNTVRASDVVTQGMERAAAGSHRLALTDWKRLHGMLRAGQGQWEEAERALCEAASLALGMPYPYARARALYEWGRMCIRRGEPVEAQRYAREALLIFRRLGARPYVERTERALAALRQASSPQRPVRAST